MHGNLAITWHERGHPDEAVAQYEAALAIEREIGSQRDEAITLCNLADLLGGQGHRPRKGDLRGGIGVDARARRPRTEAITLQQLGEFELGQGLVAEALQTVRTGLELARVIGNRRVHGHALRSLGGALLERGE